MPLPFLEVAVMLATKSEGVRYLVLGLLQVLFLFGGQAKAYSSGDECPPCGSNTTTLFIGIAIGAFGCFVWKTRSEKQEMADEIATEIYSRREKYACRESLRPMDSNAFREGMRMVTELIIRYVQKPHKYDVFTREKFGFLFDKAPLEMPMYPEKFESIIQTINNVVLPGLLHWQHPRFHGYFAAGFSYPDVLADATIAGLSVIPFDWIGAPSLAELEMVVLNWFGRAIGLPKEMLFFPKPLKTTGGGIILTSSSEIIYASLMVSRYKKLSELVDINDPNKHKKMAAELPKLIVYTNAEAHSSIQKACNVVIVKMRALKPTTADLGLTGDILEEAIKKDLAEGNIPFHVHGSLGTTNTAAIDRLDELAAVAKKYNCWFHIDGAYGGCAMICEEFRHLGKGLEKADSINVNLHKWPFTSAPVSFFWCRHRNHVQNTFAVHPVYLKSENEEIPAFRHWGMQLSRRPACLKAYFVMRTFGLKQMQKSIRQLVRTCDTMRELVEKDGRFGIVGKPVFTLFAFNVKAETMAESNRLTKELCEYVNRSCKIFVTHAKPNGIDVIRINMAHSLSMEDDAIDSYNILSQLATEYFENQTQFSSLRCQADIVTQITTSPMPSIGSFNNNSAAVLGSPILKTGQSKSPGISQRDDESSRRV